MCVVMIKPEVQFTNHKLIHCLYTHVVIVIHYNIHDNVINKTIS